MNFTNVSLLPYQEAKAIENRILEISKEYDLDFSKFQGVELTKRFQHHTAARFDWKSRGESSNILWCNIKLSYKVYQEKGFLALMQSLNHELAHWVCVTHGFDYGHGPDFWDFCKAFGGE